MSSVGSVATMIRGGGPALAGCFGVPASGPPAGAGSGGGGGFASKKALTAAEGAATSVHDFTGSSASYQNVPPVRYDRLTAGSRTTNKGVFTARSSLVFSIGRKIGAPSKKRSTAGSREKMNFGGLAANRSVFSWRS